MIYLLRYCIFVIIFQNLTKLIGVLILKPYELQWIFDTIKINNCNWFNIAIIIGVFLFRNIIDNYIITSLIYWICKRKGIHRITTFFKHTFSISIFIIIWSRGSIKNDIWDILRSLICGLCTLMWCNSLRNLLILNDIYQDLSLYFILS